MNSDVKYYLECHVTIEPVFDEKLEQAKKIARKYKFKVADLLMKKRKEDTEERSMHDTFMTGHGVNINDINDRMINLVEDLKKSGFKVWRAKLEDTLMDTRIEDSLGLLK